MARQKGLTNKQLAKALDEAARAWRPLLPNRLQDAVLSLLSTGEPEVALAHQLVDRLRHFGSGHKALVALLQAGTEVGMDGSFGGNAWARVYTDPDVHEALARAIARESIAKEDHSGNGD